MIVAVDAVHLALLAVARRSRQHIRLRSDDAGASFDTLVEVDMVLLFDSRTRGALVAHVAKGRVRA
jgi:hypothetical protein